ncbi:MAG: Npt1/Npt2 family nucleotide transporter, partial [Pseudomonadota bacterium]|nr:Npt1/Npt2 family nucleotide transporter [Pseudomonadota bacterium]
SRQTLGLLLPSTLIVLSVLFFATVLFPSHILLLFTMLGLPNINVLYLSFAIGATIDVLQKALRYNIFDVFNLQVWDDVKKNRRELQQTTNMYSGRPVKGLISALIIILTIFSYNGSISGILWFLPVIVTVFFWFWIKSVKKTGALNTPPKLKLVEQKTTWQLFTDYLGNFTNKKMLLMGCTCLMLVFGCTFLSVLKTSLVVSTAGVDALPVLKFLIIPAIILTHFIFNKCKESFKENTFYIVIVAFNLMLVAFALLYPVSNSLHVMGFLFSLLPTGIAGTINFWLFSSFYIFAELWSVVSMDVLYSPLQNNIFTKDEISLYVPIIAAMSCIGQFLAASMTKYMVTLSIPMASMLWIIVAAFFVTTTIASIVYRTIDSDYKINHSSDLPAKVTFEKKAQAPQSLNQVNDLKELGNNPDKSPKLDT